MSATDELRRLLDERGVKWSDASDDDIQHTTWNTASCWFCEFGDGWTAWGMSKPGTPEQAIAATLGRGTCENVAPEYLDFLCSRCGFVHYHSDENDTGDGNDWAFCPKCGREVDHGRPI